MTKAPRDLESHFHWNGDVFTDGQIIDTVTPRHGNTSVNNTELRAEPVWNPTNTSGAWRAVWAYSAKRARRDKKTLAAQEARARAIVAGEQAGQVSPVRQDPAATTAASTKPAWPGPQRWSGSRATSPTCPPTVMPAAEVIAKYHDLWHVEKSFRMSKTDLAARPMFHRTRDAIEAHLTIVFTALAVAHAIQTRTGLAIANVIRQLRPLRTATIAINGATANLPARDPPAQREILTHLGIQTGVLSEMSKVRSHGRFIGSGDEHGDAGGYSSGVSDCGGAGDGGGP